MRPTMLFGSLERPPLLAMPPETPAGSAAAFGMRVGIVHGNRLSAELLRYLATTAWRAQVVLIEYSAADASAAIERTQPDVVIIGHHPPLVDCLEILARPRRPSGSKLIVCARKLTEYLVHKLSTLRFHAALEETSTGMEELHAAVLRAREGTRYLSSRYVHLAARLRENPSAFPKLLSPRQEAVLVCIAHELEDNEIAQRLGMSVATAQRHRADIMRKLDLHKTPRLIRYAAQMGFDEAKMPCRHNE